MLNNLNIQSKKYRVWDIENKRMGIVSSLNISKGEVSYDIGYERHTIKDTHAIIMGKLGVDIEGTEVYELDVLTTDRYPYQQDGERVYDGVVEYSEEEASYVLTKVLADKSRRGISEMLVDSIEGLDTYKVLGNVLSDKYFREQWELLNKD